MSTKSSGSYWRRVRTPEERSKSAQKAAETRKARMAPVEVKINNVLIPGAFHPAYGGRAATDSIYFTSKRSLRRLSGLELTRNYRHTDDYAWDNATDFGAGAVKTLGTLLSERPTRVYLRLMKDGWHLQVAFHSYELWSSEPLNVLVGSHQDVTSDLDLMPRKLGASVRSSVIRALYRVVAALREK